MSSTQGTGLDLSDPQVAAAWAELNGVGSSLGFDLYASPESYVDPTAQVYTGKRQVAEADPYEKALGPVGLNKKTGKWEIIQPPTYREEDATKQAGELLADFYKMGREELMRAQRLMFAGGFYGGADLSDIQFGVQDEASFAAWARVVSRAARFHGAGKKMTIPDILAEAARSGGMDDDGTGKTSSTKIVSLSDPVALQQTLNTTAQAVLGRKATVEEQRMFVALVHNMQTSSQVAAQSADEGGGGAVVTGGYEVVDTPFPVEGGVPSIPEAGSPEGRAPAGTAVPLSSPDVSMAELQARQPAAGGGTVAVAQPSPEAQAEDILRRNNPEEAGAHDVAAVFDNFLRLLRGPVQ